MILKLPKTPGRSRRPLDKGFASMVIVVLEILWIIILSVPIIIQRIYQKIFPGPGKILTDQVVLITGAGNGLGKELAMLFAKNGSKVVCVDVRKIDNDKTVEDIEYETRTSGMAKGYVCDVSDIASVQSLRKAVLEDWGRVDILINNAGIVYANSFLSGKEDCIKRVLDINVLGSYWVTRAFLGDMKKRNKGHVVFINSMSSLSAISNGCIYSTSKFGLLGLTMALDDELRQEKSDIKITSAHPYFISTHQAYTKSFNTRVPPITTEQAAEEILSGIRREYFTFQVPGGEEAFGLSGLISLFPTKIYHLIRDFISADFILPKEEAENYFNIPGKIADE